MIQSKVRSLDDPSNKAVSHLLAWNHYLHTAFDADLTHGPLQQ